MKKNILIIVLSILCCLTSCGERRSVEYSSGAEAVRSQEAERGWVPKWIPAESREIKLVYEIDTNHIWMRFVLDNSYKQTFKKQLRALSIDDIQHIIFQRKKGLWWWPEGIIQQQPSNDGALNAEIYFVDNVYIPYKSFVALDSTSDYVYVWYEVK